MQDLEEPRLVVDLDALAANHRALKLAAGGAEVVPVVKADGYGLGAGPIARRLFADGARRFFVARVAEGEALREALSGREAVVYVLDGCPPGATARLERSALTPVLNSLDQVAAWREGAPRTGRPAVLHVDTGMNRLGLTVDDAHALAVSPDRLSRLDVVMVMSHLACAEEAGHPMNAAQLARFRQVRALFPEARASLANSAGVHLGRDYAFDLVRPGLGLYGAGVGSPRAVATYEAPILQMRTVRPGETVGYGGGWTAPDLRRVAVVQAGYADGVLRALGDGGYGALEGRRLPFLGRISMDLIVMDATDVPDARPGAAVELLGSQARLDDLAAVAGTIPYEILVRLGARTRATYVGATA